MTTSSPFFSFFIALVSTPVRPNIARRNWARVGVSTYLRVIALSISLSAWYALGTHEWLTEHATAYMATPSVVAANVERTHRETVTTRHAGRRGACLEIEAQVLGGEAASEKSRNLLRHAGHRTLLRVHRYASLEALVGVPGH